MTGGRHGMAVVGSVELLLLEQRVDGMTWNIGRQDGQSRPGMQATVAVNRHTGDAPSNQPKVAGVFPQRNVGLEVKSLSLNTTESDPEGTGAGVVAAVAIWHMCKFLTHFCCSNIIANNC